MVAPLHLSTQDHWAPHRWVFFAMLTRRADITTGGLGNIGNGSLGWSGGNGGGWMPGGNGQCGVGVVRTQRELPPFVLEFAHKASGVPYLPIWMDTALLKGRNGIKSWGLMILRQFLLVRCLSKPPWPHHYLLSAPTQPALSFCHHFASLSKCMGESYAARLACSTISHPYINARPCLQLHLIECDSSFARHTLICECLAAMVAFFAARRVFREGLGVSLSKSRRLWHSKRVEFESGSLVATPHPPFCFSPNSSQPSSLPSSPGKSERFDRCSIFHGFIT